jgi:hypothetical protein
MLKDLGNRLQVLGFSGVVFAAKPSKGLGWTGELGRNSVLRLQFGAKNVYPLVN